METSTASTRLQLHDVGVLPATALRQEPHHDGVAIQILAVEEFDGHLSSQDVSTEAASWAVTYGNGCCTRTLLDSSMHNEQARALSPVSFIASCTKLTLPLHSERAGQIELAAGQGSC